MLGWLALVLGIVFLTWGYLRARNNLSPIPAYMTGGVLVVLSILALAGLMNRQ